MSASQPDANTTLKSAGLNSYLVILFLIALPLIIASFFFPISGGSDMMFGEFLTNGPVPLALLAGGIIAALVALVRFVMLFYRAWKFVIVELKKRELIPSIPSAGRAIGFCFIPGFNIVWVFFALGKLLKDCNRLAVSLGQNQRLPVWLGYTIPIFCVLVFIPFIGPALVSFLIPFVLFPSYITLVMTFCRGLAVRDKKERSIPITRYHDLFSWSKRQDNLFFFLSYVIAFELVTVSQRWIMLFSFAGSPISFTTLDSLSSFVIFAFLNPTILFLFSILVKKSWLAALLIGVISSLFYLFPAILSGLFLQNFRVIDLIFHFGFAFVFIFGMELAIRKSGAKLGTFLLGVLASSLASAAYYLFDNSSFFIWAFVHCCITFIVFGSILFAGFSYGLARFDLKLSAREITD